MAPRKTAILVTESMGQEGLDLLKAQADLLVDICLNLSRQELLSRIATYDALLLRSQTQVDRELIERAVNLKLIGRAGVGMDNIDIVAARARNISVINTPSANSTSTAELAFALLMSLAKKIPFAHVHMRSGQWQRTMFKGMELEGKILGILGFGNVGQKLSRLALGFNMKVMACDPLASAKTFDELKTAPVPLATLLAQADFLSFHCALTDETKNIINRQHLSQMKRGVMIVNTARGELIDDTAMLEALKENHVAGLAMDVFRVEPPSLNDPLIKHPNVVLTPHIGASTEEAMLRVSIVLAEQTIGFFKSRG